MAPLSQEISEKLAIAWTSSWNEHDLEAILEHYHPNIVFTSPFAMQIAGAEDGTIRGLPALRSYFTSALLRFPSLHFELYHAIPGVRSLVLHYRSVNDLLASEMMELDLETNKIIRVICHYKSEHSLLPESIEAR
eukprot:jgi/Mesen1/9657/ME000671S09024